MRRDPRPLRVLALCLPELPLQRIERARERHGPAGPLAVVAEGRVVHCNVSARGEGVRAGATLAEARAACGRLETLPADPAADRAALRALAEAVLALAPAVEVAPPDALLLDASAAHLASGATGRRPADAEERAEAERALARQVLATAEEMGFAARAAVACGRAPARALATHGREPLTVVAPDALTPALAGLPLEALGLEARIAARLRALGVRDAGALARLPPGTLAHRFGPAGVEAARLARGEDDAPLAPYAPETLPEEALELEAPAESAEPLLFALKRLADRVAARLAGRGLGATRLRLVLALDPRGEERVHLTLAHPTSSAARWLVPAKEHLFSLRLPGAVTALRLSAEEVAAVAPEQLAFGDRPEVVAALEGVLARLAVRLGAGALFAAEAVERHRPEGAYRAVPFRPPRAPAGAVDGALAPPRPTRLLAAPELVVAEGEGGRLTALRVGGRARAVLAWDGPERLRGEWWSSPFDRDYYRVRLDDLGDCWVYRDGADGRLWLHGFFD
jgi:protein ImuB